MTKERVKTDKNGNNITPCIYDDIYNQNDGTSYVNINGKWGIILVI